MKNDAFKVSSWVVVSAWAVLGVAGCYSRVELKPKASPPVSKIGLSFEVAPELFAMADQAGQQARAQGGDAAQIQQQVEQQKAQLQTLPGNITGLLKSDLLRNNLGFPVVDAGAESDLVLRGVFRPATYTVALDWELVEVRSNAVVRAGRIEDFGMMWGNVEEPVDEILKDLLSINIDAYAKKTGGTSPIAATPSAGSLDEAPAASTDGSRTWVVVVGVERYREALPEATGAEHDAKVFASYAHATLGVPESQIKVLLGDRASRADIASALEEWLPRNAVASGGQVIVYFSGHGAPDVQTGDAYLVPWDANPAYIKTGGYSVAGLQRSLSGLKGQEVFVFLDACFSGVGGRSVLPDGARPLVPVKAVDVAPRVYTFAAAGPGETTGAREGTSHGLFTWHLLQGLGGAADADGDRRVSFQELTRHVAQVVEVEARRDNREQRPTVAAPPGDAVLVEGLP